MSPFKKFVAAKQKLIVAMQASDDGIIIFLLINFAFILN
jgi:hypothetical protein